MKSINAHFKMLPAKRKTVKVKATSGTAVLGKLDAIEEGISAGTQTFHLRCSLATMAFWAVLQPEPPPCT